MLKGIPKIISPELMKTLMEMGHGDEIVFADGNFPAAANARRLIRYDGHDILDVLTAVLPLFPLERADFPAALMATAEGDPRPAVWDRYQAVIKQNDETFPGFEYIERFAFYERARQSFAIVATSDMAARGNILLKKGIVRP